MLNPPITIKQLSRACFECEEISLLSVYFLFLFQNTIQLYILYLNGVYIGVL